jgi:hypothetical protein
MSSPLEAASTVTKTPTLNPISTSVSDKTLPENTKSEAPLPCLPFVVI